ncbi:hypothetical protein H2200_006254 [Cladophialophora chaetospira]|uniref:Uncharacterized protein n=1 Tax=Cladophialophora chaetospira TaxID=386627 RepID=A0AA38XB74_9EURO|nr:hypothetical protein H2200_006254 [Cladophialophora chaetospira]
MKILIDFGSTEVRLFFRLYFSALFLVINFVGAKCRKDGVRLAILRGEAVQVTSMTGWLQNSSTLSTPLKLRALPGGWMGLLMLLTFLLSLAGDLVQTTITKVTVHGSCSFGTGLVLSPPPTIPQLIPPHNGAPYYVVAQAQSVSVLNGGKMGIYAKVNRDPRFSATLNDVLGAWVCEPHGRTLRRSHDASIPSVVQAAVRAGLLYDQMAPPYCNSIIPNGVGKNLTSHLIILDTSVDDTLEDTFEVRLSIDTSAQWTYEKILESFECRLQSRSSESKAVLEAIQRSIPSQYMLQNWCGTIQGAMYNGTGTGASGDSGLIIEQILNSMMMVAGGGNYLLNTTASHETQGCVLNRTLVPWEVIVLAAVSTGLAKFLAFDWMYLLWHLQKTPQTVSEGNVIPHDLLTWMQQAVIEAHSQHQLVVPTDQNQSRPEDPKRLFLYRFGQLPTGKLGLATL